jgi:serine/threonine-protein kinase
MEDALVRQLHARLCATLGQQFAIRELLGAGGFAAVFRGRDPLLGRDVAIKVFDASLSIAAADRLLDEARLVAAIEHPHLVPLYEAGARDGLVFLVMRCFPDGTVGARLRREGALPPADVVRLGAEVADALAAAHARGVVHLDVKPDNILLDAHGHAAVSDFGIARAIAASDAEPQGLTSGTPHYMSPEQVAGDRLDGRTDVYALGVVLYELATGRPPVEGDSSEKVMANQIRQTPAALSSVLPELPTALARVITRALEKDPARRWPSAKAMAEALRDAGSAEQMLAPRVMRRRTRRQWYSRFGMILGGVAVGAAALVYLAVRALGAFGKGDPPAIDAMAPLIPVAMLDSVRAVAGIAEADSVRYIFAPHGLGLRDAVIVSSRELIAVTQGQARRYPHATSYTVLLARVGGRGLVLLKVPGTERVDTIYASVSGLEQQVLGLALRRVGTTP